MTKNQLIEKLVENYDPNTRSSNYNSFNLKVSQDQHAMNPREKYRTYNFLYCFHKRYRLGDENNYNPDDYSSWDGIKEQFEKDYSIDTILPVYMYDHSGLILNTTGFSCRWDSGQVGFIFMTEQQRYLFSKSFDAKNYLEEAVAEYSQYLEGRIYDISLYYNDRFLGGEGEIIQDIDTEVIRDALDGCCVFEQWSDERIEKLINLDNQVQSLLDN